MKNTKKGRAASLREAEKKAKGLDRELAELKKEAADLRYELGRYRKATDTRNKIIADLNDRLKLEELKHQSNEAVVTLLLCALGADLEHPYVVEHKAVRDALKGYHVVIALDEEAETYSMAFVMDEMK